MYRTTLVPLDGSPLTERALLYARRLTAADGRLVPLRVLGEPASSGAGGPPRAGAARRQAETYLRGLAERLGATPADPLVLEGDAVQTIVDEVPRRGIELIVMSTHGRSGLGRWLYGSVADAVMRRAGVPVFLVPSRCAMRAWPTDRPLRILVPLDYSPLSEAALSPTAALLAPAGAEVILLSVAPRPVAADPYGRAYAAADADTADREARRRHLEGIAERLRAAGHAVQVRAELGCVPATIRDVAQHEGVDLIALATHGSGGATRLLVGSVATGVVQRATVPVLVVPPAAIRQTIRPRDGAHSVAETPGDAAPAGRRPWAAPRRGEGSMVMSWRTWGGENVRRTASAPERLPAAELERANALLSTVPGLAQRLAGTSGPPPPPSPRAWSARPTGLPQRPPPRAWEFARWLYRHGRLSDEVP
jgi:nucleotide-binding universal stress UspA family protein